MRPILRDQVAKKKKKKKMSDQSRLHNFYRVTAEVYLGKRNEWPQSPPITDTRKYIYTKEWRSYVTFALFT